LTGSSRRQWVADGRLNNFSSAISRSPAESGNSSYLRRATPERRITRSEHEHLLDAVQQRLDPNPEAMRQRRETVEHPFGTMKARMGATHFLTKTLPKVAAEMALSVLAYNLTRVINIVGVKPLIDAIAT
jgi:transposase